MVLLCGRELLLGDCELLLNYIDQSFLYGHEVFVQNWEHVLFNLVESVLDYILTVLSKCGVFWESINLLDFSVKYISIGCKQGLESLLELWLEVGVI